MRQTLFHIPHELAGLAVFGLLSWGTILITVFAGLQILFARPPADRKEVIQNNLFVWGAMLLVNAFLLPRIETRIETHLGAIPVGLPIRGYGVMMMLGVLSGVWVALRRSEARGIPKDAFFSLATWTVVAGLLGARLFYVVQHWDTLNGDTLPQKLISVLQITEGGLVVYGSVIGGLAAILYWTLKYRYPLLSVADAVTPAFFLGLAFGRIGCLLNGCCYGGVCEVGLPSLSFPAGSAVYEEQLANGRILGLEEIRGKITSVDPGSWGEKQGVTPGQNLGRITAMQVDGPTPDEPLRPPAFNVTATIDGTSVRIPASEMPKWSVRVHPSQIYASIGGLILFLWTASISPYLKSPGLVFAIGLIAYGIVRILEEYIRVDELGQFGTELSISQWISLIGIVTGIAIIGYITMRAKGSARE